MTVTGGLDTSDKQTLGFSDSGITVGCSTSGGTAKTASFVYKLAPECNDNLSGFDAKDHGTVDWSDTKTWGFTSDLEANAVSNKFYGFDVSDATNCWPPSKQAGIDCMVMVDGSSIESGSDGFTFDFTKSPATFSLDLNHAEGKQYEFKIRCPTGENELNSSDKKVPVWKDSGAIKVKQDKKCALNWLSPVPPLSITSFVAEYNKDNDGSLNNNPDTDATKWLSSLDADCPITGYNIFSEDGSKDPMGFPVQINNQGKLIFTNNKKAGEPKLKFKIQYT